MQRRLVRARSGFTLIELLVVVAIIALLISILLPSLRDAREQAKVAKCLAHYRQLTTVTVQYFLDYDDHFPFVAPRQVDPTTGNISGVCSWAYGGKTTHGAPLYDLGSPFYITIEERPFNVYLMGGKLPQDIALSDGTLKRAEVAVLQCPSDHSTHQYIWGTWGSGPPIADENYSCYDDCGTSYQYNLHAMMDLTWPGDLYGPFIPPITYIDIGRELVRNVLAKQSSTYVMFMEDPMDASYGSSARAPEMGYHGRFSRYTVGFLDGHAEYKKIDTRGWCGTGWETLNKTWAHTLGTGGTGLPPIFYTLEEMNCEPPL